MNRPAHVKRAPKFFDEIEASEPAIPQIRSVSGKKRARNKSLEPVALESTPISQQPNFQQLLLDSLPSYTPAISGVTPEGHSWQSLAGRVTCPFHSKLGV
jgi:hypothetical protein